MKGCKIWKGRHDRGICYDGRGINVARMIYQQYNNVKLTKKQKVGRKCKNTKCIAPQHLFAYTGLFNYGIPVFSNREGESNDNSKLTADNVKDIRGAYYHGRSYGYLAQKYKISKTHVGRIVRYKSWSHI